MSVWLPTAGRRRITALPPFSLYTVELRQTHTGIILAPKHNTNGFTSPDSCFVSSIPWAPLKLQILWGVNAQKQGQLFLQPGRLACAAYTIMENSEHNNHGNLIKRPPPRAWQRAAHRDQDWRCQSGSEETGAVATFLNFCLERCKMCCAHLIEQEKLKVWT